MTNGKTNQIKSNQTIRQSKTLSVYSVAAVSDLICLFELVFILNLNYFTTTFEIIKVDVVYIEQTKKE